MWIKNHQLRWDNFEFLLKQCLNKAWIDMGCGGAICFENPLSNAIWGFSEHIMSI
jgi:hypothetical protein